MITHSIISTQESSSMRTGNKWNADDFSYHVLSDMIKREKVRTGDTRALSINCLIRITLQHYSMVPTAGDR
jgi:hypothetical protein